MRKMILLIVFLLLFLNFAFSQGFTEWLEDLEAFQNIVIFTNYDNYGPTEADLVLAPYSAINGVSMSSSNYPERANGSLLSKEEGNLNNWTKSPNTYVGEHIIVTGGLYNFPLVYSLTDEALSEAGINAKNSNSTKYFAIMENPNVEISIDSPTNFMFVSQSNTSYQRPFELIAAPYLSQGEYDSMNKFTNIEEKSSIKYSSTTNNETKLTYDLTIDRYTTRYAHMWFDLLLSLPLDENGVTSTGIIADGVIYDLQEEDDYNGLVSIRLSYSPTYTVYSVTSYFIYYDRSEPLGTINSPQKEIVITIPFSGFYSRLSSDNKTDSIASFYVNQRPSASNLSLNSSVTRQFIDIADISMLYNCGRSESEPSIGEGDGDIAKIFLSSRSNPYDTTASDFMLVHEDASSIIEGRNALGYTIRVTDSTDGTSEIYDGSDYINSVGKMLSDGNFIKSHCHKAHPGHLNEWSHFHTFEGTVSLLIDESKQLMVPGIYRSNVYIHLITEETT